MPAKRPVPDIAVVAVAENTVRAQARAWVRGSRSAERLITGHQAAAAYELPERQGHGGTRRPTAAPGRVPGVVSGCGGHPSGGYASDVHLIIQVSLSTEMTCSHLSTSASSACGDLSPPNCQPDSRRSSSSAVRRNSSSWYSYLAAVA